jgi:pyruvate/2-oxoglutarate dehydrogenase complex dihydrolipoamide acyltransferase (E2) component
MSTTPALDQGRAAHTAGLLSKAELRPRPNPQRSEAGDRAHGPKDAPGPKRAPRPEPLARRLAQERDYSRLARRSGPRDRVTDSLGSRRSAGRPVDTDEGEQRSPCARGVARTIVPARHRDIPCGGGLRTSRGHSFAGSKSSTGFPEGSSSRICLPPRPVMISLRKRTPELRSDSTSSTRSSTSN